MKTKTKAAVLATGLIASVGVLLPLSAHAVGETTKNTSVSVTVNPSISIDAATGDTVTADTGVQKGNINVTITANKAYTIKLSATTAADVNMHAEGITETIPTTSNVVAGTNGWGIKKKPTAGSATDATTYSAITTTPTTFYTSTAGTGSSNVKSVFEFGVAVSPSLPAGTYVSNITVTASTN